MKDWNKIFKAKKPTPGDYLRVVTDTDSGRAEMFLYGYIGQDFWWDEDLDKESITDLAFIREFRKLEAEYDEIHIRINSPGGSVFHGDAIITAITSSAATVHTYNDGMAASMGFDIWLAGDVRHMSKNAKGMVHATMSMAFGNAAQFREQAEMLDLFDEVAISMFAEKSGMTEEEVRAEYYDGKDHWMTARQAEELGLIESAEGSTETPVEDAERLSANELVHRFYGEGVVLHTLDQESKTLLKAIKESKPAEVPAKPQKTTNRLRMVTIGNREKDLQ